MSWPFTVLLTILLCAACRVQALEMWILKISRPSTNSTGYSPDQGRLRLSSKRRRHIYPVPLCHCNVENWPSCIFIRGLFPGNCWLHVQTLIDDLEDASNELMLADEEEVGLFLALFIA